VRDYCNVRASANEYSSLRISTCAVNVLYSADPGDIGMQNDPVCVASTVDRCAEALPTFPMGRISHAGTIQSVTTRDRNRVTGQSVMPRLRRSW